MFYLRCDRTLNNPLLRAVFLLQIKKTVNIILNMWSLVFVVKRKSVEKEELAFVLRYFLFTVILNSVTPPPPVSMKWIHGEKVCITMLKILKK